MDKLSLHRFQKNIELDLLEGCWLWKGSVNRDCYGTFWYEGKTRLSHRMSYEHWNGPIPKGLQLDHLCRNRNCVYPQHMEPVTFAENQRRGIQRNQYMDKTHCVRGHEFNEKNTYMKPNNGGRECRVCKNIRARMNKVKQ